MMIDDDDDRPGEAVPEENFWTLWCKGRLTEADTDHLAGRHSIWTNQCPPPTVHDAPGARTEPVVALRRADLYRLGNS